MARLDPLPPGAVPEVADIFEKIKATGFASFIRSETEKWAKVVKAAGLKAE